MKNKNGIVSLNMWSWFFTLSFITVFIPIGYSSYLARGYLGYSIVFRLSFYIIPIFIGHTGILMRSKTIMSWVKILCGYMMFMPVLLIMLSATSIVFAWPSNTNIFFAEGAFSIFCSSVAFSSFFFAGYVLLRREIGIKR